MLLYYKRCKLCIKILTVVFYISLIIRIMKENYKMEMRCLFNREINENTFFDIDINASKSPFIKSKIKIIYSDESLDRMVSKLKKIIYLMTTLK